MPDDAIPHTHATASTRRQPTPPDGAKTARFVEMVLNDHGPDFVASWLLPSQMIKMDDGAPAFQNCEFTNDTIFTTGIGADRLKSRCETQMLRADIVIRECPIIRTRFQAWGRQYKRFKQKK